MDAGDASSDAEGLFGPRSATWMIDRETALFLGGPRALLLQIAHPAVAAAVEEHSDFRSDPLGRLQRTLVAVFTIVFGDRAEAEAAAERVSRRHGPVRGVIEERSASPWSGRPYHAQDPELLLWVHATLVDTALFAFELLVRPLGRDEAARYYDESKRIAALLGIPRAAMPSSFAAFREYFDDMVRGPVLQVGAVARAQRADLSHFEPSHSFGSIYGETWRRRWSAKIDRPLVRRGFSRVADLLAAGMLPERLRWAYGYRWNPVDRAAYEALVRATRLSVRALPGRLRFLPGYHSAVARARGAA